MSRRPLYEKDEAYKRTVKDTKEERDSGYARLYDFKDRKKVELFWDFNESVSEDGVFRIRIGDEEAYLDAEQFRKYLRWV